MSFHWFIRKSIFFFTASFIGWLIFIIAIGYAIYDFIEIDSRSHSVSDTLMNFVFDLFLIWIVYSMIGLFTSRLVSK